MALPTAPRSFIGARKFESEGESAQQKIRNANIIARHANATTAQATNGMSAPFSVHDMSPSAMDARAAINARDIDPGMTPETADDRWARLFPNRPDGTPRIDARAGTAASNGPAQTSPPPTMTPSAPVQDTPQYIDPNLAAPAVTDTGIQRMSPQEQATARESLYQTHPHIFEGPDNADRQAFVAHAKQYGEQSAHDNLAQILPQKANPAPAPIAVAKNTIDPYQFAQD